MFSRIRSAVCSGIEGRDVWVETDVARGLPGIFIVGLASTMIMESRERIKSAIGNSGFEYPRTRITVNLTPASQRKNGSCLDLPIAVGILTSGAYVDPAKASEYGIIGELSLEGKVLGIDGVLPMLLRLKRSGVNKIIIPADNILEASMVKDITIIPVRDLRECIGVINGTPLTDPETGEIIEYDDAAGLTPAAGQYLNNSVENTLDFADIYGQSTAKRAITIAVTGRHGLLMVGSPGCGKTMLASRIPGIMPLMSEEEMIETAIIYSATGKNNRSRSVSVERPFRNPHHTIGRAGLIGGGTYPIPGEITLAHNGVLFLDEVCEFGRDVIEGLRTPLEEKQITHFRQGDSYTFPCDFQLVMASNPCPCGYYGDPDHMCKCTETQLERYRKKLSGPMMDRIDMKINMEKVTYEELRHGEHSVSSAEMRAQVENGIAFARSEGRTMWNACLSDSDVETYCRLGDDEERFMNSAYDKFKMSPRSYKKTLRVARTIADIDNSRDIRKEHLAEALCYRMTDNKK